MIPLLVGAIVVAVVAFFVWVRRYARRVQAEGDARFARLATDLGAAAGDAGARHLEGSWRGRPVTVSQRATIGSGSTDYSARVSVPVATTVTLELHGQSSALGARLVGDVAIGDADFDANFIVRTNDVARVAAAIPPELRPRLVAWRRHGWLTRVFVKDGRLQFEHGRGLNRAAEIDCAAEMIDAAVTVAEGLERPSPDPGRPPDA